MVWGGSSISTEIISCNALGKMPMTGKKQSWDSYWFWRMMVTWRFGNNCYRTPLARCLLVNRFQRFLLCIRPYSFLVRSMLCQVQRGLQNICKSSLYQHYSYRHYFHHCPVDDDRNMWATSIYAVGSQSLHRPEIGHSRNAFGTWATLRMQYSV
jgi:hypothetical protein